MTEQVAEQAAAAGDAGEVPIKELSIEEAMRLAISMQQQGALDNAEEVYRRILSIEPGHAGAKHFLGLAVYHLNRKAEGIALVHESIALVPGEADWHSNLGNLLMEDWRLEEAHDCYKSAIRLNPGHANAVSNLGMVYRGLGMNEEAEQTFLRAIWLDSKQYAAFQNLGALYHKLGRVEEAIQCFLKAIIVKPKHNSHTRALLGRAYSATGQIDKAADVYRTWLAEEPDSPAARHMLAAVTEQDVPGRASDAYVTAEFDGFASSFDAKLEELEYKAPQFMAEALGAAAPGRMLDIIDAGCGTGLCGPLVKAQAKSLTGVDLSQNMLNLAVPRNAYDALEKAELTAFLEAREAACDAIISADTLCYFGRLEEFSAAALGALRADGVLIFSVEAVTGEGGGAGYIIQPHGRYAHRRGYLETVLQEAGFRIDSIREVVLRQEILKPVHGFVVTARKP